MRRSVAGNGGNGSQALDFDESNLNSWPKRKYDLSRLFSGCYRQETAAGGCWQPQQWQRNPYMQEIGGGHNVRGGWWRDF